MATAEREMITPVGDGGIRHKKQGFCPALSRCESGEYGGSLALRPLLLDDSEEKGGFNSACSAVYSRGELFMPALIRTIPAGHK